MKLSQGCSGVTVASNTKYNVCRRWCEIGTDLLFPPTCPLCGMMLPATGFDPELCDVCQRRLASLGDAVCHRCGAGMANNADQATAHAECGQCRGKGFRFAATVSLGAYQDPLKGAVVRMKHAHEYALTAAVGRLLAEQTQRRIGDALPDVFVFTPMHWKRRFWRRASSAERLAQVLGQVIQRPVWRRSLRCRRNIKKQSMLSIRGRRENVRGAFAVSANHVFKGKHVGLVDDTLTTGATADALTRLMLSAGASCVTVVIAARAVAST